MDFIEVIRRKQIKFELKFMYLLFWKIKIRFLFGLIGFSLLCYAFAVGFWLIVVENENLFITDLVPVALNPITVVFICVSIVVVFIIDNKHPS